MCAGSHVLSGCLRSRVPTQDDGAILRHVEMHRGRRGHVVDRRRHGAGSVFVRTQSRCTHDLHTVACLHVVKATTGPGCMHTTQSLPVYSSLVRSTCDMVLHMGHFFCAHAHSYPRVPQWSHTWAGREWVSGSGQDEIVHCSSSAISSKKKHSRCRRADALRHSNCPCPRPPHCPHLCAMVVCDDA